MKYVVSKLNNNLLFIRIIWRII